MGPGSVSHPSESVSHPAYKKQVTNSLGHPVHPSLKHPQDSCSLFSQSDTSTMFSRSLTIWCYLALGIVAAAAPSMSPPQSLDASLGQTRDLALRDDPDPIDQGPCASVNDETSSESGPGNGPVLGPIVYEICTLIDDILDATENVTDEILNPLPPSGVQNVKAAAAELDRVTASLSSNVGADPPSPHPYDLNISICAHDFLAI
ncbi:hypothetical protein BJ138DRAFT_1153661 [Hygrophoropsis aurantiaca]|uniref:Uncharacterized protein n=1 Tax=Hygrophoropsis aurantiaca TaxID=72124 RepID=A0ACB8AA57_9AGAM|nr:hypothetical protein BJ138DRAFT_1153661 [Hygrophoropsis aurantiaca]